jgi:hypothetical protein
MIIFQNEMVDLHTFEIHIYSTMIKIDVTY